MNKIKVIDLLNMISKGEEVPKKIKWQDTEYEYVSVCKNYVNDYEDLLSVIDGTNFSDEIEIIHKNKKLKKIKNDCEYDENLTCEEVRRHTIHNINLLKDTINEIIDYLMDDK